MGGSVLPVGPFNGGLNIAQPSRLIGDNELSTCQNFDIGAAGELTLRKGVRLNALPVGFTGGDILAVTRLPTSLDDEIYYQGDDGSNKIYWTAGIHNNWTLLHTFAANTYARDAVQYNSKLWIPTTGSGAAAGISVDISTHAVTSEAAMPKGSRTFIYKDRMFVFNADSYRVYYSASLDPATWPGANFFDINPGDGEPLISAIVSGESVIFFKQNSTWVLYYDTDPGLGTLRKLNTDIGISSRDAVTMIGNDVYVMNNRGVYRLINGFYEDISKNLDIFNLRTTNPSWLGSDYIRPLGDKLIVRLMTTTGYRYFVYSLEANVWTEYTFATTVNMPFRLEDADHSEHYVSTTNLGTYNVFTQYGSPTGITEEPVGVFATKFYDYGDPAGFKRLFWLSFEISSDEGFSISVKAGEGVTPATTIHEVPDTGYFEIFKNYLSQRFRTIQFSLTTNGGGSFILNSGSASVAAKKRVVERETV